MKYCAQCGMRMNDQDKFCSVCGTPTAPSIEEEPCGVNPEKQESCPTREGSAPYKSMEPVYPAPGSKEIDLIGYLQRVTALETSVYGQARTVEELEKRIDTLGHPTAYAKPEQPAEYTGDLLKGTLTALTSGGFLVGLLIWFFSRQSFLDSLMLGALLCVGLVVLCNILSCVSENKRRQEQYDNEYAWYTAAVKKDELRVKAELAEKDSLMQIVYQMRDHLKETEYVLEQYYSCGIIFQKYRNLIAMCSFYEYFLSGRCDTLTGHEGAYNIFENEARLDRICTKLDEVIQRLEDIKANQYMLYDVIQEGNRITEQLVEESVRQSKLAERTAENTALAAHYAQIAANNAEACAWIGVANHLAIRGER